MSLKFTEHALFRYCQRVLGADVTWLRDQLSEELKGLEFDGYHKLRKHDAVAVIKDGCVLSIMTEAQARALRKKPRTWRFKEAREDY